MVAALSAFVFAYPVTMSVVWVVGALYYWARRERGAPGPDDPPDLAHAPGVSVLVPFHDEERCARETVLAVLAQRYPDLEVVAVDDGSTDGTAAVLAERARQDPRVRVVHLEANQGKAVALRTAVLAARHEHLVCVDADAVLHPHAVRWMVWHLTSGPRVGAVTGNPRIRNRSTLLGRLQVGEFSSIVGLIKRAQRTYGRVFTVSGVLCAFRRTALHRVGYWSDTVQTEDIDISWRLQMDHWDVRYEPRALASILMPDTLGALWRQRLRWARGGAQVVRRHAGSLLSWRRRRMWPVLLETLASATWAVSLVLLTALALLSLVVPVPAWAAVDVLTPSWLTVVLATVCLLQFAVSVVVDRRYEPGTGRTMLWMIWYPVVFWLLGTLSVVAAAPGVLLGRSEHRATWTSPTRRTA